MSDEQDQDINAAIEQEEIALENAKAAKEIFKQKYWAVNPDLYNGIGIGLDDDLETYVLRVYFLKETNTDDLPKNIDGINIKYIVTGKIVAQKL